MSEPPSGGSDPRTFRKEATVALVWTALVMVGVLCLLNLVLIVGIIRRLREQTADIAALGSSGQSSTDGLLPPGSTIGAFAATTTTGDPVVFSGPTVVGLFLTDCGPCKALLPSFIEYAQRTDLPVLAVVTGEPEPASPMVESLLPVADVVLDGRSGPVASAFQATSFPEVYLVDGDRVLASGRKIGVLPMTEAVPRS
jgi:thiol-disulfide isomerase/thioredoxin